MLPKKRRRGWNQTMTVQSSLTRQQHFASTKIGSMAFLVRVEKKGSDRALATTYNSFVFLHTHCHSMASTRRTLQGTTRSLDQKQAYCQSWMLSDGLYCLDQTSYRCWYPPSWYPRDRYVSKKGSDRLLQLCKTV